MLSQIKSSAAYAYIRKLKYKIKRAKQSGQPKLTLDSVLQLLEENFEIKQGDAIFVHCGFGFLNAAFTPLELIELLKKQVGETGLIMMPFYPPGLSSDWLKSGRIFDPKKVKCSTGVLAQTLASDPQAHISSHPIKAVVCWGEGAKELTQEHILSRYPYDKSSPYYKFAQLPRSFSIGLGVRNCAMVHSCEDIFEQDKSYLYTQQCTSAQVKQNDHLITVNTYVHHGKIPLCDSHVLFDKHTPEIVNLESINGVTFYQIDNHDLFRVMEDLLTQGINRKVV